MAGIIGIKKRLTDDVEQETNTIIRVKKNKLAILAYDEESIANAEDLLRRSAALAQDFEENPKKVFMNYEKNEMIRFIKPPPKLVVGFGTMLNNPYVLSCEIPKEPTLTLEEKDKFMEALKAVEEHQGRVKFQARFGKSVFYNLSDEATNHPLNADDFVRHAQDYQYRCSLSTGSIVDDDVHAAFGESLARKDETYNFKTIVRQQNGEYSSVNINVRLVNGEFICANVTGKEKKNLVIDYVSISQNMLDIRLALQTTKIYQHSDDECSIAMELVESLSFDTRNEKPFLSFCSPPNMIIYNIRHKVRKSYILSGFKLDISEVESSNYEGKVRKLEQPTGVRLAKFADPKTEVEVSIIPWRKAFKYNRGKVGGEIGERVQKKYKPEAWKAEDIINHFDGIVEQAKSLVDGVIIPLVN